jgi:ribosome maturation factor RimP
VGESPLFCWAETGTQIAGSDGPSRRARVLLVTRQEFVRGGDGKREMELERIRDAAERVARSVGMDVVDVEWKVGKQRFLRIYIDKPEGISHRDCETVSNQLSVILDVEDLVPGSPYILEVSSPGLDRKLMRPAEFERFAGRLARISMLEPVENQKFFEGRLAGVADGKVQIEVKGRVIALPMEGIRKANLVVEF